MLRNGRGGIVRSLVATAVGVILLGVWGSQALSQEKKAPPAAPGQSSGKKEPRAIIKTKLGEMEIKFFSQLAPQHVENFIKLAKGGVYNGTIFHRVIPGFMIQGGDPNTKDPAKKETYGQGGPGYTVKAEFNDTPHKRGIVSMARAADPDSAGSQFFVVVEDSRFLDGKYTVFGEVVKGIGVADKIVSEPRVICDPQGRPTPPGQGSCDNPLERIEMTVTIVE